MVSQWNLNKSLHQNMLFMTRTYDYVTKLDLSFIPFYSHVIELDKLFFPCFVIVNFESIFWSYVKNCVIFKHTFSSSTIFHHVFAQSWTFILDVIKSLLCYKKIIQTCISWTTNSIPTISFAWKILIIICSGSQKVSRSYH